ncbi:hypothetical protein B0H19DRAFT_1265521 [Mycena capillaripes]|nr:hypothetical protein B0H19DRAFT_1265521 [Mycena capillaripes]
MSGSFVSEHAISQIYADDSPLLWATGLTAVVCLHITAAKFALPARDYAHGPLVHRSYLLLPPAPTITQRPATCSLYSTVRRRTSCGFQMQYPPTSYAIDGYTLVPYFREPWTMHLHTVRGHRLHFLSVAQYLEREPRDAASILNSSMGTACPVTGKAVLAAVAATPSCQTDPNQVSIRTGASARPTNLYCAYVYSHPSQKSNTFSCFPTGVEALEALVTQIIDRPNGRSFITRCPPTFSSRISWSAIYAAPSSLCFSAADTWLRGNRYANLLSPWPP